MVTMTDSKVRRPGYTPDNVAVGRRGLRTRTTIVRQAARLFAEHGFHGTSIDTIAKAAGGSRAAVYQYFQSKDDILAELVDEARTGANRTRPPTQRSGPRPNRPAESAALAR